MKIAIVFGTRAETIKVAPLLSKHYCEFYFLSRPCKYLVEHEKSLKHLLYFLNQ